MGQRVALIGNQAFSMLNFRGALIREIVARGHEVFAFAPDFDDSARVAIRALGATPMDHGLARTGMNPFLDALGVLDLARKLRQLKPDVAMAYSIKPVIYGTVAAWMSGVGRRFAMIEGLGHTFLTHSFRGNILRTLVSSLYKFALARAEATFFLNPDDRNEFMGLGLVDINRTEVIGGIGVDLDAWRLAPPVTSPMTFLFIGRLLREKGLIEFVAAAREVKSKHRDVQFVILGSVDSNPSSISVTEVESWISEGLVRWPGQVDVAPWIARSSIFVLPSYREGVPRSTQEAMAMGRPVITTDVPGCRETVEDGRNGYLVPAKDSAALARAMMNFVNDPEETSRMGLESRKIAEQRFDVKTVNARVIRAMGL